MRILACSVVLAAGFFLVSPARAFDLDAAWATDRSRCDKVFVKKGNDIAFRPESDVYGTGFIIKGNTIKGKKAKCTIKARREDGDVVNMVAACATDIMLSDIQLNLKVVSKDSVLRVFPGMGDIELAFDRCSF
jgi:hypothetical protein